MGRGRGRERKGAANSPIRLEPEVGLDPRSEIMTSAEIKPRVGRSTEPRHPNVKMY